MDKRWILILIIFIVGCSCLYLIVDSSTTVGDAITVVNKSVVTLPDGFTIADDDKNSVDLIEEKTHEKIHIKDEGKKDVSLNCFKNELKNLKQDSNINIINNSTSNISNILNYRIDYVNLTTDSNTTIDYFYSCNHTFLIKMEDYSNKNNLNNDLNFLIETISPDFKQSQD